MFQSFLNQTPAILWFAAIIVLTVVELASGSCVPWRHRLINLANGVLVLVTIFLSAPFVADSILQLQRFLGLRFNPPFLLDRYVSSPFLAALAFLLCYDIGYYWFHRLQHNTAFLWRIHSIHHSETQMSATSYVRQHVSENVLQSFVVLVPLLLLVSVSPATFAWVAIVSTSVQFFAHADLPVHFGPASWLLISPRLHRVHHSIDPIESNANYASMFPVLDVVFGTYRRPAATATPTGLHSGQQFNGLPALLLAPFTNTHTHSAPLAAHQREKHA